MPSISACGLFSSVGMSLHAPGSDSSAFTTRVVRLVTALGDESPHFRPVGNPAPPRPRSTESFMVWTTSSGCMARALPSARYPPWRL